VAGDLLPNERQSSPAGAAWKTLGVAENQYGGPGQVQRLTCYSTRGFEATPGGRINRLQRMRHPTSRTR